MRTQEIKRQIEGLEKMNHVSKELKTSLTKDEAKRILKKGADVSIFGDPIEWQKKDRTDRDEDLFEEK